MTDKRKTSAKEETDEPAANPGKFQTSFPTLGGPFGVARSESHGRLGTAGLDPSVAAPGRVCPCAETPGASGRFPGPTRLHCEAVDNRIQ